MDNIKQWNAVVTISLGQSQSVTVTEVIFAFAPKLWVCTAGSNLSITLVTIRKHTKFGNTQQQDRTYVIL